MVVSIGVVTAATPMAVVVALGAPCRSYCGCSVHHIPIVSVVESSGVPAVFPTGFEIYAIVDKLLAWWSSNGGRSCCCRLY